MRNSVFTVLLLATTCDAFVLGATRSCLAAPAALRTPPTFAVATAKAPQQGPLRKIVNLPVAIWRRCTPDECTVGRPRPLEFIKSFIPRRRPLARLRIGECSEGVYKVERTAGKRVLKLFPTKPEESCELGMSEALEMF